MPRGHGTRRGSNCLAYNGLVGVVLGRYLGHCVQEMDVVPLSKFWSETAILRRDLPLL